MRNEDAEFDSVLSIVINDTEHQESDIMYYC